MYTVLMLTNHSPRNPFYTTDHAVQLYTVDGHSIELPRIDIVQVAHLELRRKDGNGTATIREVGGKGRSWTFDQDALSGNVMTKAILADLARA